MEHKEQVRHDRIWERNVAVKCDDAGIYFFRDTMDGEVRTSSSHGRAVLLESCVHASSDTWPPADNSNDNDAHGPRLEWSYRNHLRFRFQLDVEHKEQVRHDRIWERNIAVKCDDAGICFFRDTIDGEVRTSSSYGRAVLPKSRVHASSDTWPPADNSNDNDHGRETSSERELVGRVDSRHQERARDKVREMANKRKQRKRVHIEGSKEEERIGSGVEWFNEGYAEAWDALDSVEDGLRHMGNTASFYFKSVKNRPSLKVLAKMVVKLRSDLKKYDRQMEDAVRVYSRSIDKRGIPKRKRRK